MRVLTLAVSCIAIVLAAFLCGCNPQINDDEGRGAAAKNDDVAMKAAVYEDLALAHYAEGRYADAVAAYKKIIAIKPDHDWAHFFMGDAYQQLKEYAKAIAVYKKDIAIKPNAGSYYFMGVCYVKLKEHAKAIDAFEKAITIEPNGSIAKVVPKYIRMLRGQ